jgi:addiction module HigA family antidote
MPTRKAPKLAPIHPGEILLADVHEPLALSQYRLAQDISVPPRRINEIVHGTRAVTADTCRRALISRRSATPWDRGSPVRSGASSTPASVRRCTQAI